MESSIQKAQADLKREERKERNEKAIEAGTKALAIFGLIILLGLISIGIIKTAPVIIRGLANAAVSVTTLPVSTPSFAVSASQTTVESGQAFVVSWVPPNNEAGSFTVSYPCIGQFYLEAVGQNQSAAQSATGSQNGTTIYCNSDFQFLNTGNSIVLAGSIQSAASDENGVVSQPITQPITVPITVHFLENGAVQNNSSGVAPKDTAAATVDVTVLPEEYQAQASASAQTPAVTSQPSYASQHTGQETESVYPVQVKSSLNYTPNTNADLAVSILATGIIDPDTNAFVPENAVSPSDRGAIQFQISNQGGRPTGSWSFSAILPTYPSYVFMSNAQPSLNPGDSIVYTIAFNQIQDQPQDTFTINADNTDSVTETDKTNNIVHGILYVNDSPAAN